MDICANICQSIFDCMNQKSTDNNIGGRNHNFFDRRATKFKNILSISVFSSSIRSFAHKYNQSKTEFLVQKISIRLHLHVCVPPILCNHKISKAIKKCNQWIKKIENNIDNHKVDLKSLSLRLLPYFLE